ncbi:RNA-directed DNA polymerase from mobile element jockey-like, partial [Brachionus plicatilis]
SYCETSSIAIPTRLHHARLRHSPKWFNANIKKLTKSKYKLHCQIRSAHHNLELRASYALVCKRVKSAVRHSICKFEAAIVRVCKRQPKLLYNYINSQKQCKETIKGLVDSEGVFHTDGGTIAHLLNAQFGSVFIPSSTHAPIVVSKYSSQREINLNIFSPESIRKYIERLNPRKSPGMDHIHPFVVKSCASKLTNTELFMGEFDAPHVLKSVEFEKDLGVTFD